MQSHTARRVTMVTHYFEGHGGGVEIVAGQLARQLADKGHGVTWCATGPAPRLPHLLRAVSVPASSVLERAIGLPMPVPSVSGLRRIARAVAESDVVVVHDALYPTSVAAFLCARHERKPILLVQHIGAVPYRSGLLRFAMRIGNRVVSRRLLSQADQVVFISEAIRSHFGGSAYKSSPVVVFNGVDPELFKAPESCAEKRACRDRFGIPANARVLLFVGRFVEKKGLGFIQELAREHGELTFVLAGSGGEDPLRWDLPNVVVSGSLLPADLGQLYRASDLLILPSVGEGFPLVIQEALASGLPVICGRDSAEADPLAARYLHAVEIEPRDVPGTVARLSDAIRNALAFAPSGDRTLERSSFALAQYSWPAAAARYSAMIDDLVEVTASSKAVG